MYLGPAIMYSLNLLVMFCIVVYYMVKISPQLTLYVLVPLPVMSFLIYKVSSKINKQSTDVQSSQSRISTMVQEYFSGIRILKSFVREEEIQRHFDQESEAYKNKSMVLTLTNALFLPTIMLLIGLSTLFTVYIGGLLSFKNQISVGDITSFIFYISMLTWPFASLGWVTSIVQRAEASQARINEFLKEKADIVNPSQKDFHIEGAICFDNVSFTYPNSGIEAIKNVHFKIKPGEILAIVGKTGSGKSTLIHLLTRLFDPTEGTIYIDGENLSDINLEQYRDQIGVVPQEVFLFSETIENNIRFGATHGEAKEDELINAAKLAHVYHNITQFKDGMQTILGERGVNLSGGQKQRISIARALIRNPKILCLDDCLSAVDTETEEVILNNLNKTMHGKTQVIVSHRVSSIQHADTILVINNGTVIERGNHQSLLLQKGQYAEMYEKQLLEGLK
jgi:ATP-binding cassette subfamily B protein